MIITDGQTHVNQVINRRVYNLYVLYGSLAMINSHKEGSAFYVHRLHLLQYQTTTDLRKLCFPFAPPKDWFARHMNTCAVEISAKGFLCSRALKRNPEPKWSFDALFAKKILIVRFIDSVLS